MSTRILENRFELEKQISHTDFSTVYLGCDRQHFQRPPCLITAIPYHQDEMRFRLEREAQVLERLGKTPQIPRVLAYFHRSEDYPITHPGENSPQPSHPENELASHPSVDSEAAGAQSGKADRESVFYLVQELLAGHPISQEITSGKKLSESYVNKLLQDTLSALSAAHNQGIVHQNLHPQHIIRQNLDGQIFLTHFGTLYRLAKSELDSEGKLRMTMPTSPHPYISPEQHRSDYDQQPQPASDLYALGLIAIEALLGQPHYYLKHDPEHGLQWRDQVKVSLPLAEFIDRLIRQDWRDRFSDAQAALDVLQLASDRYQIAHNSRLPTVVAAPAGRIPTQFDSPRRSSALRISGSTSDLPKKTYSTCNIHAFKPTNPYLLKMFIGSLAVLIALGIGVKTYQWGQHQFTQLPQSWESWTTAEPIYPQATATELIPVLKDGSIQLRESAADAFWEMVVAAQADGVGLYPLSGYRNPVEEPINGESDTSASLSSEDIAASDYPTGYAIDIGVEDSAVDWQIEFAETEAFAWLERNAESYGFELSLPEQGLTGGTTSREPWHWRYVSDPHSREVFGNADK